MIKFGHAKFVNLVHAKSSKNGCFIIALYTQMVCLLKVSNLIENPAKYEVCAMTQFLHVNKFKCMEIHYILRFTVKMWWVTVKCGNGAGSF